MTTKNRLLTSLCTGLAGLALVGPVAAQGSSSSAGYGAAQGMASPGQAAAVAAQGMAPVDRGWYAVDGVHDPLIYNYIAGNGPGTNHITFRNWFVFDLACVSDTITSASLLIEMPTNGFSSVDPSETYALFDVSTTLSDLMGGVGGLAAYTDLGTGTSYGSVVVSDADNGLQVVVPLNAAGLAALNGGLGGQVGLGGAITTLDGDPNTEEKAFSYSTDWAVRLIITPSCDVRDADDRGWYSDTGLHQPSNMNYIVGNCPACSGGSEFRNFFVFDFSDVDGLVTAASLALEHTYNQATSDPSETYTLFEVTTPKMALLGGSGGLAAFNDLADGTVYGSYDLASADGGSLVKITLDATGLAALNGAAGGQFILGGAITTLDGDPSTTEVSFGSGSPGHCISQMILNVEEQWTYLDVGLAGTGGKVPLLMGTGDLIGGDPATLTLADGKPGGSAYLVVGLTALNVAFKGGVLVPSPDILASGLPLDGSGGFALATTWPTGVPSGFTSWWQVWIPDAAGPVGFSASNGLMATTP